MVQGPRYKCRLGVFGWRVQECTDDQVAVDNLMEVGSRLMCLAVQKHPACRAPQFHLDE